LRFDQFDDIPENIRAVIEQTNGPQTLEEDRREMDQAAVMWVAIYNQEPAGVLFSRKGRDFRQWFVELKDNDMVLFRMRTHPEFRGRGIAPFLMSYAMHNSLTLGCRAFIDCRVYNTPSIRAIEKAGFDLLSTMKPISREFALGKD
jgi:GNAT superfamily N-acetyltransferase